MLQKDYIMRLIQMFFEFLSKLLSRIEKGEFEKAEEEINHAYVDFLKQDAAFFYSISKENLSNDLIRKHNYTREHLEILSELFNAEAELRFAKHQHKISKEFYEKSLILLRFVISESKTFSFDKEAKLKKLETRIDEINSIIS